MWFSKCIFSQVDHAIFQAIWQWAMRRHRRKGKRWVMRKYFAQWGGRAWCFFGEKRNDGGPRVTVWLYHAASLPIRRDVKIKRDANPYHPLWNPYHPLWEVYFESRESSRMAYTLAGRGTLIYLWRRQNGRCIRCGELITRETGWHRHSILPRCWAARTAHQTDSFFTQNAIANCMIIAATNAASLTRRLEGLSRVSWKLTALRGAVGGNADRLLDLTLGPKDKQPYAFTVGEDSAFAFACLWDA